MPEVIELRKYRDFLKKHAQGATLTHVQILKGRYKNHGPFQGYADTAKSLPLTIRDITVHGKLMWWTFSNGMILVITLGLTGGWIVHSKKAWYEPTFYSYSYTPEEVAAWQQRQRGACNVAFHITKGNKQRIVYFADQLSYGTLQVLTDPLALQERLRKLGPDVMHHQTTFEVFRDRLLVRKYLKKPIGVVLMDQAFVAGVGNYLRADSLWLAKISPFRAVQSLSLQDIQRLYNAIIALCWAGYDMKRGINLGFIKPTTEIPQKFKRDFLIYQQKKDPYGKIVESGELSIGSQKRTIFWVPSRQL